MSQINGVLTSTTVTLLEQLKITVSSLLQNFRSCSFLFSAKKKGLELQVVHIFFDTSTFDRVEKDVKVAWKFFFPQISHYIVLWYITLIAQLGLIGGTMGLFTGCSVALRFYTLLQSSSSRGEWHVVRAKMNCKFDVFIFYMLLCQVL